MRKASSKCNCGRKDTLCACPGLDISAYLTKFVSLQKPLIELVSLQRDWRDSSLPQPALPQALVHVSATEGIGIAELKKALERLLQ